MKGISPITENVGGEEENKEKGYYLSTLIQSLFYSGILVFRYFSL
jgi:hypothetical protein